MTDDKKIVDGLGAFNESLNRSRKQITSARANDISEDAETEYRRFIEDLSRKKRKLERARFNRLDMSPENALSLKLAQNFIPEEFVDADIKDSIDLRNIIIKIEVAVERFKHLFGKDLDV